MAAAFTTLATRQEKSQKKGKKAPPRPNPLHSSADREPEYDALVEVSSCVAVAPDTYRVELLVLFSDFFETDGVVVIKHKPAHQITHGDTVPVEGLDLGVGSANVIAKRQALIVHLCSHVVKEVNIRIGQVLANENACIDLNEKIVPQAC